MSRGVLYLESVSRTFARVEALSDLSLSVGRGEFVAVVGPSGCGKTTLLNLIAGHDTPTEGAISRSGTMRMIYQNGSLFPWMTVAQNVMIGLREVVGPERGRQLEDMVNLVGLQGFEGHYPHQLSGGMRQRVELARALAGESDFLLLDEPFSALDYITRLRLRAELSRVLEQRPRTAILVTHDIEEAAQLADRVIVLSERPGRIRRELQVCAPRPRDPTSPEVVQTVHIVLTELGLERNAQ